MGCGPSSFEAVGSEEEKEKELLGLEAIPEVVKARLSSVWVMI